MHQDSITHQEMERIESGSRDNVYIASDFFDLGEYNAVRQALLRLEKAGKIQKIMRGVYLVSLHRCLPNGVISAMGRSYHQFQVGNVALEFKHRNNREISGMSPITAMIIQALKAIGKGNLNEKQFEIIRRRLSDADKVAVLNEAQQTSVWLSNTIKQICS